MSVSPGDPIDVLGLSIRPRNALARANIHTVEQLLQGLEGDLLQTVRNFGVGSLAEVQECLAKVELDIPLTRPLTSEGSDCGRATEEGGSGSAAGAEADSVPRDVLRWQQHLIKKSMSLGLLHGNAKVQGQTIDQWLAVGLTPEPDERFEVYATILGAGLNICEEEVALFEAFTTNRSYESHLAVLLLRYGYPKVTLAEVGKEVGLTRERIRQIGRRLETGLASLIDPHMRPMLRVQSALLMAQDIGFDITYNRWASEVTGSGLVGRWPEESESLGAPLDVMLAICRAVGNRVPVLEIPENLSLAVQLASDGNPDLPASLLYVRENISKDLRKLIRRHTQFSGAASAPWLAEESGEDIGGIRSTLWALRYREASNGWYLPPDQSMPSRLHTRHVFHHAVRKMGQFCGPLSVDELCSGLRHSAWQTQFPIPPAGVLTEVLSQSGLVQSDGLWHWDGRSDEALSSGEEVILRCIGSCGIVVHHAELAQAFIDSELSFPSLHSTLHRSPLFRRIAPALYVMRSTSPSAAEIKRAESAGGRTSVDAEVKYTTTGHVEVELSLGILAVGTGVVFSERLPNLSGDWDCWVDGTRLGKLTAAGTEFRRLLEAFAQLGCQVGDRVRFVFNTWDRTVTIEKVHGMAE